MTFVQATTGSGGWPMSVWLTPDLKPFYGGTYFPPDVEVGTARVCRHPAGDRTRLAAERDKVDAVRRLGDRAAASRWSRRRRPRTCPSTDALARTVAQFRRRFDARHGGFGDAPKFPRPSELLFLLREHARTGDAAALRDGAQHAARDGAGRHARPYRRRIPPLLGRRRRGACRISRRCCTTRRSWCSPISKRRRPPAIRFYIEVAEDTLRYVMREMTDEGGGFYSAEDADSVPPEQADDPGAHKTEGAFYLWRAAELDALLGDAAPIVKRALRHRGGRQRADRSAAGIRRQEPALRRAVDRRSRAGVRPAADGDRRRPERARLTMFQARLDAPAAAPRRQGAHRVERPDDCRVRAHGARAARAGRRRAHGRRAYLEAARARQRLHPRPHVGRPSRGPCCAATAMATRRSTATRKTTRT